MKKLLVLCLALALTLSFAGVANAEFAAVPKEELKVGFIYIGDVSDLGYTYAHHQGTLKMQAALGLTDEQILIKKNIAEDSSCETAIRELVEQGCDIIFGNSFGYLNYFAELSEEYPEVRFAHCSGYMSNDVNLVNYFGRIYEARYLAGIAAGLKSLETGNNHLGYVAAFDTVPEVVYSLDAYYLGAKSVNPDATMTVKVTNSWLDPTAERQCGDALTAAGCGIIAQHCDTTGPVVAAQEAGVFAVGYNADMSDVAPTAFLTAPVWDWSVYLTQAVQAVIDGTWSVETMMDETKLMGLADGIVALAPLSNCAEGTQEAIDAASAKIISGELGVFQGPITDNQGNVQVAEGQTLTPEEVLNVTWFVEGITVG